jgi:hypothetical protein
LTGLFADWKGNVAFDATFLSTMGKRHNPSRKDRRNALKARVNISYDMGEYWHGGNRDGDIGKRHQEQDRHGVGTRRSCSEPTR